MLNKQQTQIVLEKFFKDCENFWKRTGRNEREAFESALDDTKHISTDPFSPRGDKLDPEVKAEFIKYREQDLGK
jgi:hypothetical protein